MIFDKKDITSETFFKFELIAIEGEQPGTVNILKNKHTGEIGNYSKVYYNQILAEYEDAEDFENPLDRLPEDFKELFRGLSSGFEDAVDELTVKAKEGIRTIKPKVEKFTEDLAETIKQVEKESQLIKLEVLRESAIREKVATGGFLKKIDRKISVLRAIVG